MPQLNAVPLTPFGLPTFAKSVNGIPLVMPAPISAIGMTIDAISPLIDGALIAIPTTVQSANAYPRGGFDCTNFFTSACPNCGQVHHVYTSGGYFCYALGPAFGVSIDLTVVYQDYTTDAWAAVLVANDFVIES